MQGKTAICSFTAILYGYGYDVLLSLRLVTDLRPFSTLRKWLPNRSLDGFPVFLKSHHALGAVHYFDPKPNQTTNCGAGVPIAKYSFRVKSRILRVTCPENVYNRYVFAWEKVQKLLLP